VSTPLVVGIGGSTRPRSSTDRALRLALDAAEHAGARVLTFDGLALSRLPLFRPEVSERPPLVVELVSAVRQADGVILATPSYHGGVSGTVKNALDYLEDLRQDWRPYLDGRAVGCIVTAAGWQAAGTTLTSLRAVIHALRGWPTPLGAALNTAEVPFDGPSADPKGAAQLAEVGRQVVAFCQQRGFAPEPALSGSSTGISATDMGRR